MNRILIEIIKQHGLMSGDFTLSSGKKSNYYIDIKKVLLTKTGATTIGYLIARQLEKQAHTQFIGGIESGAWPLVAATLVASIQPINGFVIRKTAKTHGIIKNIEGTLLTNSHVTLLEDVTTTGRSVHGIIDLLKNYNVTIDSIISVVDRKEGAKELLKDYNFISLVKVSEVLGV